MRRLDLVLTALVLPGLFLAGCQQHRFMTEGDFRHYRVQALNDPCNGQCADEFVGVLDIPSIRTVAAPEGKRREITLSECVAISLENGRTGELFDRGPGVGLRPAALTAGRASPSNSSDSIRVFSYDPAIQAVDIEESLSKFDAFWSTSMVWNRLDQPQSTQAAFFRTSSLQREQGQFQTQLLKPLPTGGLTGITFRNDYDLSSINQSLQRQGVNIPNPSYTPVLEFEVEQPLLQGMGVFVNELRERHPGGVRSSVPVGGRVPGILLARIAADQVQLEYENRIHSLCFQVEQAYWRLYCAYWDYYSRETAMRQAHLAWHFAKLRLESGKITGTEFAQIEQQFHLFRAQRVASLGNGTGRPGVLEAERELRYLIGLPPDDGYTLIPIDAPTVAPFVPDWSEALQEAVRRRPELIQVRMDVQANQLAVLREKDFLLPDIRVGASYNVNALGSHLDGTDPNSALRNLAENANNDWLLFIRATVPIGYREAHSEVRRAQLQLAQRIAFLRDNEIKVAYALSRAYRSIFQAYEEIRHQRARRIAATQQLDLLYKDFLAGRGTIDVMLEAQRNWADALRDEHFAICDYNIALADFERQKGTILEHDNVSIIEGPLPECAQARASAHIRERARSIILKEGFDSVPGTVLIPLGEGEAMPVPDVSTVLPGASVPALLEQQRALPPVPEYLPRPSERPMPKSLKELRDQPLRELGELGEQGGVIAPVSGPNPNAPLKPIKPAAPAAAPPTNKPANTTSDPSQPNATLTRPLELIPAEPVVKQE